MSKGEETEICNRGLKEREKGSVTFDDELDRLKMNLKWVLVDHEVVKHDE